MVSKPERSPDTPASGRIATATDHVDAHATVSNSAFARAPSYSPEEIASFRDFANVMRDAIGEKGSFNELKPKQAAERGCLGTLKSLHRRGRVTFDKDLCMAAAYGGQLKVLKWLLENSCPWDEATDDGETPLHMAAREGDAQMVQCLLEARADINKARDDGATALFLAAQNGHEAVVRALIEAGADVNKAADDSVTPLIFAAQEGHEATGRGADQGGRRCQQGN